MGRLLATIVLLATTMAPAAALELPDVRAAVVCPPVTLDDFAPPAEIPPADDEMPPEGETPPDDRPPENPPTDDPPPADPPAEDLPPECDTPFVYDMGSPFVHDISIFSSFGAPRPEERLHKGIDIAAPKMTPVVAVADGVVFWVSDECCNVAVRHRDGWTSYYIHLNNDTYRTDDGLGTGVAPGIIEGAQVRAGQLLGWAGDSGNAEETESHLHFELRMPNGQAIDAAASLRNADQPTMPALPIQPELDEDGNQPAVERYSATFTGPFADDDGDAREPILALMASWGLLAPCDETGLLVCPDRVPTGFEWMDMLAQAGFESPDRPGLYDRIFVKDPSSTLDDAVAVRGCGVRRYCPDQPVTNVEASGVLTRSTAPLFLPPLIETLECNAFDATDITRAGLVLRLAELLGAVIEPPCDLID